MKKRRVLLFVASLLIAILIFISTSLPWWDGDTPMLESIGTILPFETPNISLFISVTSVLWTASVFALVGAIFATKSLVLFGASVAMAIAVLWFMSLDVAFSLSSVGLGIWSVVGAFCLALCLLLIRKRHVKEK